MQGAYSETGFAALAWTSVQAIVWIATRSSIAVDFAGASPDAFVHGRLSLSGVLADDGGRVLSSHDAESELRAAILDGRVGVFGVPPDQDRRVEIPNARIAWLTLDHGSLSAVDGLTEERWDNLVFLRDNLLQIWPAQGTSVADQPAENGPPANGVRPRWSEIEAWARGLWGDPPVDRLPPEPEIRKLGKQRFGEKLFGQKMSREVKRVFASTKAKRGGAPYQKDFSGREVSW